MLQWVYDRKFELTVTVLFDHLPDLQGEVRQKDVG